MALKRNRIAGHSKMEKEAKEKYRVAGHSEIEEEIKSANRDIFEISFLYQRIIKCN